MTERLHLLPRHRAQLEALLSEHLPDVEVWAYGSRVNGQSHDGSDLDLVLRGPGLQEIDIEALADFGQALHDSTIPFLVEARDWARLPERFRREIEREYVVVNGCSATESPESGDPCDWKPMNLGQACTKIGSGATPRGGKEIYLTDGPYALVRSQNIFNDGFRCDGLAYIGDGHAQDLDSVEVLQTDVLLNITGESVARACQVDPRVLPARVNQHVAIIRPDPEALDPGYLRYALVCPETQAKLLSWAGSGGTRKALTKAMIEAFDVHAPEDVLEQCAIARVLGTLDDKIELNRRMTETLEAMARALFKSWFVNFDPVRAKMEGRDTGLPQDIAEFFPDRLVDSETGELPDGWRAGTLADAALLNPESWSHRNAPDSIRYVDLANTKSGYIDDIQEYTWAEAPSRGRRVLRRGDTIVGTVRPGNRSFALIDRDGLTGSTGFAVLRPRSALEREIVWCAATSNDSIGRLAHLADGGAYPAVRPGAVLESVVALPEDGLRLTFSSLAAPLLNRAQANRQESAVLAALRDTLLPKLVSGEIRVPDADSPAIESSSAQ